MSSSYATIKGNLASDLAALKNAVGAKIADVVYGRSQQPAGYPAVRYYLDGVENELLSGGGAGSSYRRGYRWRLEVLQERNAKDAAEAEDALGAAVDALMDSLESNWNLGSANDIMNPATSETVTQQQEAARNTIIIPILATTRTIHSHSS